MVGSWKMKFPVKMVPLFWGHVNFRRGNCVFVLTPILVELFQLTRFFSDSQGSQRQVWHLQPLASHVLSSQLPESRYSNPTNIGSCRNNWNEPSDQWSQPIWAITESTHTRKEKKQMMAMILVGPYAIETGVRKLELCGVDKLCSEKIHWRSVPKFMFTALLCFPYLVAACLLLVNYPSDTWRLANNK